MMINGNRFETYFSPFSFSYVHLMLRHNNYSIFFIRVSPSIEARCDTTSASGTMNFVLLIGFSGNRCIFASMLRCTSLVHPCTSVARFSPKFQVPLTDFCYASSFNGQADTGSKNYNDSKNSNYLVVRWLGEGKTIFHCFDERAEQFVGMRMPYEDC